MRFQIFLITSIFSIWAQAQVSSFVPQGSVENVDQVIVTFKDAKSSLGDVNVSTPVKSTCLKNGKGRWVDTKTWIYEFDQALKGGQKCSFEVGSEKFFFNTGAPTIERIYPPTYRAIEPDQNFIIKSTGVFDEASIKKFAHFVIEGIGNKVPVEVVQGYSARQVIAAAKKEFQYDSEDFEGDLIVLRSKLKFPNGKRVSLMWDRKIESENGLMAINDRNFDFNVVEEFVARIICDREKPEADCSPLSNFAISFNSSISYEDAKKIAIVHGSTNKIIYPQISQQSEKDMVSYLTFSGPLEKLAEYEVQIPKSLRDSEGRFLSNQAQFPFKFKTSDFPTLLKFTSTFGVVESLFPVLPLSLRHIEQDAPNRFFGVQGKFDQKQFPTILKVLSAIYKLPDGTAETEVSDLLKQKLDIKMPLSPEKAEVIGIPLSASGFYAVEFESPLLGEALSGEKKPYYVRSSALVTDKVAHIKYSDNEVWVWVTDLQTGKPRNQQVVQVFDTLGNVIATGKTNAKGLSYLKLKQNVSDLERNPESYFYTGFFVVASDAKGFTFTYSGWDQGIEPWRYQIGYYNQPTQYVSHSVIDRTLVKPGETVHVKTYLRKIVKNELSLPSKDEWPDKLQWSHESGLDKIEVPIVWNTVNGFAVNEWETPQDIRTGKWSIKLLKDDQVMAESGEFSIQHFELPLVQLSMELPSLRLVSQRQIPLNLQGQYLSGGAVAGLEVNLNWHIEPFYFTPKDSDLNEFSFANGLPKEGVYPSGESFSGEKEHQSGKQNVRLDAKGIYRTGLSGIKFSPQVQSLVVEGTYKDPNGRFRSALRASQLWPSNINLGIKTDSWQTTPDKLGLTVLALDLEQQPLANVAVSIELYSSAYYSHRKRLVGGFYSYEDFREVKKIGEICRGMTDAKGLFKCQGKTKYTGNVVAVAKAVDKEGRTSYANVEQWIVSPTAKQWFSTDQSDRADLLPFKKTYEPGELAELQLRTPFSQSYVLVTVERDSVLYSEVLEVKGENPIIRIPIKKEYMPGVVVSAFAVRGRIGSPPASALVDLAKPSFRLGMVPVKVGYRSNSLSVDVSVPKREYKVRESVKSAITVKDAAGLVVPNSDVTVIVVDEAILALKNNTSWDVLDAMMKTRSHDIKTSTAQSFVVGKRHFGAKAVPVGGDGGGSAPREVFDSLIYWNPNLKTDAQGKVSVSFDLNDSSSSFRIVGIANSGKSQFGNGWVSIRANQDVVIYPALSSYGRVGDQVSVGMSVRNVSKPESAFKAQLKVNGQLLSEKALSIEKDQTEVVSWSHTLADSLVGTEVEYAFVILDSQNQTVDAVIKKQIVLPRIPTYMAQTEVGVWPELKDLNILGEENSQAVVNVEVYKGFAQIDLGKLHDDIEVQSFEGKLSRAILEDNQTKWNLLKNSYSKHSDRNGLLKYFEDSTGSGDVALSAFALSILREKKWSFSVDDESRLLDALSGFVYGRVNNGTQWGDRNILRAQAISVLSQYGRFDTQMLSVLRTDFERWPLSVLVGWYSLLTKETEVPQKTEWLERISQIIHQRYFITGRKIEAKERFIENTPWLLSTADVAMMKWAHISYSGLSAKDRVKMITALREKSPQYLNLEKAWLKSLESKSAEVPVTGSFSISYQDMNPSENWVNKESLKFAFPVFAKAQQMTFLQKGEGTPWYKVQTVGRRIEQSTQSGLKIQRTVVPLQNRKSGQWSVGDTYTVKIKVQSPVDQYWVAIQDAIPAGATLIASQGGDFTEGPQGKVIFNVQNFYRGDREFEYTLKLHAPGKYHSDGVYAKAMYSSDVFAYSPVKEVLIHE